MIDSATRFMNNSDRLVKTAELPWSASPVPGVWRKRLRHEGDEERGIVTSLVRFDGGASFREHDHPEGEEILVLSGVFSDHTGHYGQNTHLLNPEGFVHAPFSREGCLLFVRLRQYPGTEQQTTNLSNANPGSLFVQTTLASDSQTERFILTGTAGSSGCTLDMKNVLKWSEQAGRIKLECFVTDGVFMVGRHALADHEFLSLHVTPSEMRELMFAGEGCMYVSVRVETPC